MAKRPRVRETGTGPTAIQAVPEFTMRAVVLGFTVGLALTAAITYLALYSGVAISAAIPAAVICTGVVRVVLKRATILENNLAQTIASSGEALAVGVVFTMPALILVGVRAELSYWETSLVGAIGGLLGVLFMIPLRRTLMVDSPELQYPESVAAAKIAKAGEQRQQSLVPMALAVLGGALFKVLISVVQVISGAVEGAFRIAGRVFYGGIDVSLALIGVGVFVGIEYSSAMVFGGALSWLVAIPLVADASAAVQGDLVSVAWDTWSSDIRFIGLGAMIVGAGWSIIETRQVIARGVRWTFVTMRRAKGAAVDRAQRDLSTRGVIAAIGLTVVATFFVLRSATGSAAIGVISTLVVVSLVLAVAAVSSYTVGLVGNSNNPSSALAICALLIGSVVLVALNIEGDARLSATILFIAAFVCTASATAGDTAQHLKTGAILGATPHRQQLAQLMGVVAFAFIVAPIVVLLLKGYGIGTDQSGSLKAPHAVLFANLADMLFGTGSLPRTMLWIGVASAVAIIAIDLFLGRAGSAVRLPVMPIAIGMYLPLSLTLPMLVGALLPIAMRRVSRRHGAEAEEAAHDRSTLLWSGLITGEALVGVSVAVPLWLGWGVPVRIVDSSALSLVVLILIVLSVWYLSFPATVRRTLWRRS